jgi:hypothetical protein
MLFTASFKRHSTSFTQAKWNREIPSLSDSLFPNATRVRGSIHRSSQGLDICL